MISNIYTPIDEYQTSLCVYELSLLSPLLMLSSYVVVNIIIVIITRSGLLVVSDAESCEAMWVSRREEAVIAVVTDDEMTTDCGSLTTNIQAVTRG